jgi:hypothetical protein
MRLADSFNLGVGDHPTSRHARNLGCPLYCSFRLSVDVVRFMPFACAVRLCRLDVRVCCPFAVECCPFMLSLAVRLCRPFMPPDYAVRFGRPFWPSVYALHLSCPLLSIYAVRLCRRFWPSICAVHFILSVYAVSLCCPFMLARRAAFLSSVAVPRPLVRTSFSQPAVCSFWRRSRQSVIMDATAIVRPRSRNDSVGCTGFCCGVLKPGRTAFAVTGLAFWDLMDWCS